MHGSGSDREFVAIEGTSDGMDRCGLCGDLVGVLSFGELLPVARNDTAPPPLKLIHRIRAGQASDRTRQCALRDARRVHRHAPSALCTLRPLLPLRPRYCCRSNSQASVPLSFSQIGRFRHSAKEISRELWTSVSKSQVSRSAIPGSRIATFISSLCSNDRLSRFVDPITDHRSSTIIVFTCVMPGWYSRMCTPALMSVP